MSEPAVVRLSEVTLEGVGKRHGARSIVEDLSIAVRPGEFYSLLGPAGSGKSTVLRMLAGLERPDAGRIAVDGEPIDGVPPEKRNVGLVFPRGALWPHLSVYENVAFGLRARGETAAVVAAKVQAALVRFGLDGVGSRAPTALTDVDRQRAALARSIVVEPRLLLLDEPCADLDGAARAAIRLELARLHRDLGITTVHASRDPAEALALSSRVAVLSRGRVAQEARPEELYWRPRNRFVADYVGAANLVAVRVVELRDVGVVVETAGGVRLPVASGGHRWTLGARALLCLRPEALRVEEAALAPGGIPGRVLNQVFEGARQLYDVDISGATLRVEALTTVLQSRTLKPGDHVRIEISPETSVLLPDEPDATADRVP